MEGKIEVNGVNLWYRISGEGEPVAQIHGAGFGHFNFAPATPGLAKHFQVIDYDMRGYGQSDRPVQRYDMEVWADDAAGLLEPARGLHRSLPGHVRHGHHGLAAADHGSRARARRRRGPPDDAVGSRA